MLSLRIRPSLSAMPFRILLLSTLLLASIALALTVGPLDISITQLLRNNASPLVQTTLIELRLPRVVLACLAGAALAISGVIMQALFRNPLADPGLTGLSSGAALATSTVIVFGGLQIHPLVLPAAAFSGALVSTLLILAIHQVSASQNMASLLLAGIAINAIAAAGLGALSFLADDFALRSMTFWQFGSLGKASWHEIAWASLVIVLPLIWLCRQSDLLNALLLGESEAFHLGFPIEQLKWKLLIAIALTVGASVALTGLIGFVGLVVPHILRLLFGPNHRLLLPASALLAASLLLVADTVSRTAVSPAELPIGIITAGIGGPFFIWLLLKQIRA